MSGYQDYYEGRDTEYRGDTREDGMRWNGGFGCYDEPDDLMYCSITQDLDGKWQASVFYLGGYNNVVCTAAEELEIEKRFPDRQERLQYLWENHRRPMPTEYIEDPIYETKAQKELRESQQAKLNARLEEDGLDPVKQFDLLANETVEEKLAREAAGGAKG